MTTRKILIVDDEEFSIDIVMAAINDPSIDIATAKNGLDAMELIRKQPFDLVVSDIMMPSMSGLDLLVRIREEHFLMPVVFITGHSDQENILKAWRLGAFDFIYKPFKPNYLKQVVESALLFGKSFAANKNRENSDMATVTFDIPKNIANNFEQFCILKKLDQNTLLGAIIAKYLSTTIKREK